MNIDLYSELKRAIKDALTEWYQENQGPLKVAKSDDDKQNLFTVKQFCERNKFISEGALRNKLFNREYNKFDKCISVVGRKILVNEKLALDYFSNPPVEAGWYYDKNKYK